MATGRLLKKHFEIFKKECLRWVDIFGLQDWEWTFNFDDCSAGSRAEYNTYKTSRMVVVYLNDNCHDWNKPTEALKIHELKKTAFHEVTEIMLNNLRELAMRDSSYDVVDEATHKVVRTLENVLFPKY